MTTAIQKSPGAPSLARSDTFQSFLTTRRDEIAKILPQHVSVDRMIKTAVLALAKTPELQKCTTASMYRSLLICAELGLEPNTPTGQAYLLPFNNKGTMEVQTIIGYRGMISLARRSGDLEQIEAHVVGEGDHFEVEFGLEPKLRHVPNLKNGSGKPVAVYMVARLKGGARHVEVMTIAEVAEIRKRSKAANSGPWVSDFAEMAKKTVIRRGAKYLPLSSEILEALDANDAREFGRDVSGEMPSIASSVTEEKPTKTRRMAAELKAKNAPAADDNAPTDAELAESYGETVDQTTGEVREPGQEG